MLPLPATAPTARPLREAAIWLVVALGLLRMVGQAIGSEALDGLAFATAASPLPLVFSHYGGMEPFSSDFEVELQLADGRVIRDALSPAVVSRIEGPLYRRSPYGLAIAFGPGMERDFERAMAHQVVRHGLCGRGTVARALGAEARVEHFVIRIRMKTAGRNDLWELSPGCPP